MENNEFEYGDLIAARRLNVTSVSSEIEKEIIKTALLQPQQGSAFATNELFKKGINVSVDQVEQVWLDNQLETFPKRLVKSQNLSNPKAFRVKNGTQRTY